MDDDEAGLGFHNWVPDDVLASIGVSGLNLGALGLSTFDYGRNDQAGNIGEGEGEDFEDEVDNEIKREEVDDSQFFGTQTTSGPSTNISSSAQLSKRVSQPQLSRPRKKRKVVTEPEKPRDVKDVWPTFEPGKILNFTQLLQGKVDRKAKAQHQPYPSESFVTHQRQFISSDH